MPFALAMKREVTTPLRAAIVGCGRIGANTAERLRETLPPVWFPYSHLDALREVVGVELVAVCDQNEAAGRMAADTYGASRCYVDGLRMIDEVRPDILLIATRTEGRARLIEHAAEKGVGGVHFEKPLAHSVMECRHALAAAEVAGVKLSYGAVRRCMDVPRRVKKGIDAEEMGMLRQIVIECGRVELLWSHPHHFDLITFFAGLSDVEAIQARMTFETAAWSERVLDADPIVEALSIQFRGRLSATILPTGSGVVRLICERGEYVIGGNTSWLAVREYGTGIRVSGEREVSVPFTMSGRRRALMELASAVRGEGATSYSAADILRSNQLGLAGAWSAVNQGRMVRLDEVPDDFTVTGRKGDLFA